LPNEIIYSGEPANSVCVKGQPLFEQDDADDRAVVDQARRLLQQAQDQLANLRSPTKPTEITQAQANLRDAQAARDRAQEDLRRSASLLKSGSTTAQAPMGRLAEISAQTSMVDSLQAALNQAEWRWISARSSRPTQESSPTSLYSGGETLAAGPPVPSLLPPQKDLRVLLHSEVPTRARPHRPESRI
jgi:HlyD family secretion protein